MSGSKRIPIACVVAILGAAAAVGGATPAGAAGPHHSVAPKQYFTAAVNGRTGEQGPVAIQMACAGPVQPGKTGHPLSGQTVGITQIYPPSRDTTTVGYTGDRGTTIGAFFGAPPPAANAASSYVNFTRYGTKAIPTSLVLPCSGSGQVTFVALPLDPSGRSTAVPVTFVGQP